METFAKVGEVLSGATLADLLKLTPDERARLFDFSEFIAGINHRLDGEIVAPVEVASTPVEPPKAKRTYNRRAAAPVSDKAAPDIKCPHCDRVFGGNAGLSAHIRFNHKDVAALPKITQDGDMDIVTVPDGLALPRPKPLGYAERVRNSQF